MTIAQNHERLFEAGVTDGVNIQMVKDEEKIAEIKAEKKAKLEAELGAEKAKEMVEHSALNNVRGTLYDVELNKVQPSQDYTKYAIIQCWYTKKNDDGSEQEIKQNFFNLPHMTTVKEMKEKFSAKMGVDAKKISKAKFLREPASAGFCHMKDDETLFDCKLTDGHNILMKL